MIAIVSFLTVLFFFEEVFHFPSYPNIFISHIVLKTVAKPSPKSSLQSPEEQSIFLSPDADETYSVQQLLAHPPVIISIMNHMSLNFLFTCAGALVPLFFAMPSEIGGVGLRPAQIGYILGIYRAFMVFFVLTYSPRIIHRYGERFAFTMAIVSCMSLWTVMPIINICVRSFGVSTLVWAGVVFITLPLSLMEMGTSASISL